MFCVVCLISLIPDGKHPHCPYVSPSKRTVCHLRSLHHGLGVGRHVAGISKSRFLFSMWLFPEEYATAAGRFFLFKGFPCTSLVSPHMKLNYISLIRLKNDWFAFSIGHASHVAFDGDPIVPQKRCGVRNIDNLGREKVWPTQPTG